MKHVFTDVDGCMSGGKGEAFNLEKFAMLKTLLNKNNVQLYFTSGRSQPYLEALSQAFDSNLPYFCENGAAIYDPVKSCYSYSVDAVDMNAIRSELVKITHSHILFEPGKEYSLSFRIDCLEPSSSIEDEFAFISESLTLPEALMMTHSSSAIDIVPKLAGKGKLIHWFLKQEGLLADDAYGFGDAENDLSFLKLLGKTGAPNNASDVVKSEVDYVSEHNDVSGLIDFINDVVI